MASPVTAAMIPLACAVCGSFSEASRDAFAGGTALLTFLPLVFIGMVLFYLRRRYLEISALELGGAEQSRGSQNQR